MTDGVIHDGGMWMTAGQEVRDLTSEQDFYNRKIVLHTHRDGDWRVNTIVVNPTLNRNGSSTFRIALPRNWFFIGWKMH